MDPYNPHPPIDNILFLLQAFVRVYQTTTQPFNFLFNVPEEQIVQVYIKEGWAETCKRVKLKRLEASVV